MGTDRRTAGKTKVRPSRPKAGAKRTAGRASRAPARLKRAAERPNRASARTGPGRIEIHPLTLERWPDFVKLFGPSGLWGGCWCMFPRLRGAEFTRGMGEPNRRAMNSIVRAGEEPGLIAYVDGAPAGWCALGPRERYPRIENSPLLKRIDDKPVWAVVCFYVARPHRRSGLTVKLLETAAKHARRRGATTLEGYPIDPRTAKSPDAFGWHGLVPAFRAAGFAVAARPKPGRVIMRLELGRARRAARTAARG
jgi:GNAT superfamily N-acetyltransferase